MAYPKIVYQPEDAGSPLELVFSYPPVQKPAGYNLGLSIDDYLERSAERHDSITSSGVKQSIHERTDKFMTLQLDFLPQEDLPDWAAFMDFALEGGEFDFYPDADTMEFASFTLDDTNWQPKFSFRGMDKVSMKFRLVVEDSLGS